MDEQKDNFGDEAILRVLEVPVSALYDWRNAAANPCDRKLRDAELTMLIKTIHADSDGVYDSPRIHAMLHRQGQAVSRKRSNA